MTDLIVVDEHDGATRGTSISRPTIPEPKPLVWTATADSIPKKVARGPVALETTKQN